MDADKAPFVTDTTTQVVAPFALSDWLDNNKDKILREKCVDLFTNSGDNDFVCVTYTPVV